MKKKKGKKEPELPKCPKCNSANVVLAKEWKKHTILFIIVFRIFGYCWLIIKSCVSFFMLIFWDWWNALTKQKKGKDHIWVSKRMMKNKVCIYACNDCGHKFMA